MNLSIDVVSLSKYCLIFNTVITSWIILCCIWSIMILIPCMDNTIGLTLLTISSI